jgi:hypothetical protein
VIFIIRLFDLSRQGLEKIRSVSEGNAEKPTPAG